MKNKYSLSKLKKLLALSPSYAALSSGKKADIEGHIKANHVSILQYIYYTLLEEQAINERNAHDLSEKILKISQEKALQSVRKLKVLATGKH